MVRLTARKLTKKYNRNVVFKNTSFDHSSGVVGIAGSNGSGKSTLLKCLAGLVRPNSGTIEWSLNDQLLSKEELKSMLGYVAPYIDLYEELTVLENLQFLADVSFMETSSLFFEELMNKTEILPLENQLYKSLSTGQQQRVKLAAALVRNPKILLLDEPGSNLDKNGHELIKCIVQELKEKNRLVIIASNDPNEIALCDEIVVLGD